MNQKLNKIRQILVALILIAAVGGFSSCEKYSYTHLQLIRMQHGHFQTEIQPIFNANCVILPWWHSNLLTSEKANLILHLQKEDMLILLVKQVSFIPK